MAVKLPRESRGQYHKGARFGTFRAPPKTRSSPTCDGGMGGKDNCTQSVASQRDRTMSRAARLEHPLQRQIADALRLEIAPPGKVSRQSMLSASVATG